MSRTEIKITKQEDKVVLDVSGQINEDFDFSHYVLNQFETVQIDLRNVKGINSCGVREWIRWMETSGRKTKIEFAYCTKLIVDQINMIRGFLPTNGKVTSFYVPYGNFESGIKKDILFIEGKDFEQGKVNFPEKIKDVSGVELEIDIMSNKYFKFITSKNEK